MTITYADLAREEQDAIRAFRANNGRNWKSLLVEYWLNDHRAQWGTLRSIRNMDIGNMRDFLDTLPPASRNSL